ncbi:uncharacterized protein LOC109716830 [Ananas comosus]|uniref:Uncharacterized protein LOC109716830 n=2 Tax=Ananas comosus TaxID=4615 RepID=A0A6P5FWZ9_ANACO|nr:uncharacterized protein LOC109716830 [Ananas comosus]CAD1843107.1 unnamed protein product [Ananas comosus var. bracteatus]
MDPDGYFWFTLLGFIFLTYNSITAVYHSNGDRGMAVFVVVSYLDLLLLFWCLRQFERAAPNSPQRERLKSAVWLLATLLTAMFSNRVAGLMPWPVAVLVWLMAAATILGGFYGFFLYRDDDPKAELANNDG